VGFRFVVRVVNHLVVNNLMSGAACFLFFVAVALAILSARLVPQHAMALASPHSQKFEEEQSPSQSQYSLSGLPGHKTLPSPELSWEEPLKGQLLAPPRSTPSPQSHWQLNMSPVHKHESSSS